MFMGKESRYFFHLQGNKKDISLLEMDSTGGFNLKKIRWTGDHFKAGKKEIYFGLDLLKNPERDENKSKYNKVLQTPSFWSGCKTPVLVAFNMVSFATNPHILPLLERAKKTVEPWTDSEKIIKKLIESIDPEVETEEISINLPVNISNIHEYIDASTASYESYSFESGLEAGKLLMTKPKSLPPIRKLILPIGIIVLLLILLGSGAFGDVGSLFRARTP
jgi:hypothetical protein